MRTGLISILLPLALIAALFSFGGKSGNDIQSKKGTIRIAILYPNGVGKRFDMAYYEQKHMPMVAAILGDSLQRFEIDKGIAGRGPDDTIPYLAIGYLYVQNLSAYRAAMKPYAERIRADIPNYTNIQPIIQVSEVVR